MKLLLFDIDGTLMHTHGVGRRSVETVLSELVGREVSTEGISFSGKTDPQILREVLVAVEAEADLTGDRFPEAVEGYQRVMRETFDPEGVTVLPGAVEIVERLAERDDVQLALLTGNLQAMAYLKMRAIGLDAHFPFGAFGCDSENRNELPAVAVERAEAHAGRTFQPEEIVVIGDTPRDVDCARAYGTKVVAVATGRFSREELAEHGPDLLLDDLSDLDACIDAILAL